MPVLVQNRVPGPSVFADIPNNLVVEWQGEGDEGGEDIQQVPESLLENMNFLKAVRSGIFEIVEASAAIKAKLETQGLKYQRGQQSLKDAAAGVMDETSEQTLTSVSIVEDGKDAGKVTVLQKQAPALRKNIPTDLGHIEIPKDPSHSESLIEHPSGFNAVFGEALPTQANT